MFGINQISWAQFAGFILSILLLWYLSVILLALYRQRKYNHKILFEEDRFTPVEPEGLNPISVSAHDYPTELIPVRLSENIVLPVSLYEETGMDEGYSIDIFSSPGHPELPKILDNIQHQQ